MSTRPSSAKNPHLTPYNLPKHSGNRVCDFGVSLAYHHWIDPKVFSLALVENYGFKTSELRMIEAIIEENKDIIVDRWNEYFKKRRNE